MLEILFALLNYFWLSDEPVQSAKWYCDQHCFKIGAEVMESIWDVVLVLAPNIEVIPSVSTGRHSKKDSLWHPLSVWNGLCRANTRRSLVNANEIFKEHHRRTGTKHKAWKDCKELMKVVDEINFNSGVWKKWYASQNGDPDTKYRPVKTKPKDLEARYRWMNDHGRISNKSVFEVDRNTCSMTEPPQCINEKLFPGCRVSGNAVEAYRRYYNAKTKSFKNQAQMRYFYSAPPFWLKGKVQRISAATKKKIPYKLDEDGFCVVVFLDHKGKKIST